MTGTPWWDGPLVGFDLETTSADPEDARIVTACIVENLAGGPTDSTTWLADPGIDIPEGATAVHGITTEHARAEGEDSATAIAVIIDILKARLIDGVPLVAFNAAYDFTVLDREARRHGYQPLSPSPVVDPFVLDKQADRYRRGKRTLTACATHYGVTLDAAHTADADALAAVHVARAIGRTHQPPADPHQLHAGQIQWRAQQSASLQEYLRRTDRAAVVDPAWPVRELVAS